MVFEVINVVNAKRVELVSYQLKGVARVCTTNGRRVELKVHQL